MVQLASLSREPITSGIGVVERCRTCAGVVATANLIVPYGKEGAVRRTAISLRERPQRQPEIRS